ncbi:39S ribosomal protein L50, mitochondrial [Alligator sinensis]|uniref:Large ribosomal subunit protein mL50 n=1 Tax=Alligator sinensis TaxID=38654 RepID=A0A1U7SF63_ALLSI|nr:39S ribosomal protein L50, mitochondrial [Alligator sinensis]
MEPIVKAVYRKRIEVENLDSFEKKIIITPKNKHIMALNNEIITLMPGEIKKYYSTDSTTMDDSENQATYPIEFLNAHTPSGLPPHKLQLKIGAVIYVRNTCVALEEPQPTPSLSLLRLASPRVHRSGAATSGRGRRRSWLSVGSKRAGALVRRVAALRGGLWGGRRNQEAEAEAETEVKNMEPALACPPPRSRRYVPPENLSHLLKAHVQALAGPALAADWQQTPLGDLGLRYHLLAQLAAELGHTVPNSQLHQMRTAQDVFDFYSTPVKDASKFDELCTAKLPPNLKITWEY